MIGESGSGKTWWDNKLHRLFPDVNAAGEDTLSIFFNPNEVRYLWGDNVHGLEELKTAVRRGSTKIVYWPRPGLAQAEAQLRELRDWLFDLGRRSNGEEPWFQLIPDEAQMFNDVVEDLCRRARGKGGRIVPTTQYPSGLAPGLRTNCHARVIFKPGIEGQKFLRDYGAYPHEEILRRTALEHHWVSYRKQRGWRWHPPV